uniref:Uncharacterized protein n=1 Tax=Molossus molossus TaxID=27622 RepID=A0A7J8G012_MOLMO|nr:hypothetical protein HJG59_008265 [Molossus molossus]
MSRGPQILEDWALPIRVQINCLKGFLIGATDAQSPALLATLETTSQAPENAHGGPSFLPNRPPRTARTASTPIGCRPGNQGRGGTRGSRRYLKAVVARATPVGPGHRPRSIWVEGEPQGNAQPLPPQSPAGTSAEAGVCEGPGSGCHLVLPVNIFLLTIFTQHQSHPARLGDTTRVRRTNA